MKNKVLNMIINILIIGILFVIFYLVIGTLISSFIELFNFSKWTIEEYGNMGAIIISTVINIVMTLFCAFVSMSLTKLIFSKFRKMDYKDAKKVLLILTILIILFPIIRAFYYYPSIMDSVRMIENNLNYLKEYGEKADNKGIFYDEMKTFDENLAKLERIINENKAIANASLIMTVAQCIAAISGIYFWGTYLFKREKYLRSRNNLEDSMEENAKAETNATEDGTEGIAKVETNAIEDGEEDTAKANNTTEI